MQEPTFLILAALAAQPLHGYGVIQSVAELSGGDVKLRNAPGKTGLIAEISLPRVKTTADLIAKQRRGDAAGPVTATAARPAPAPAASAVDAAAVDASAAGSRASDAVLPGPMAH